MTEQSYAVDAGHPCAQSYGAQRAQRMIGLKFRDQAYRHAMNSPRRSTGCSSVRSG